MKILDTIISKLDPMGPRPDLGVADRVNKAAEASSDRRSLYRYLFILGICDLSAWACVFLFPVYIRNTMDKLNETHGINLFTIFLFAIFGVGFFLSYCLLRLKYHQVEKADHEAGPMSYFEYSDRAQKHWWLWLFSVAGGFLNLLLLIAVEIFLSSGI